MVCLKPPAHSRAQPDRQAPIHRPTGFLQSSAAAAATYLHIEVHDANVGVCGWALRVLELMGLAVLLCALVAYTVGFFDKLSTHTIRLAYLATCACCCVIGTLLFIIVRYRTDDQVIRALPCSDRSVLRTHSAHLNMMRTDTQDDVLGELCSPL